MFTPTWGRWSNWLNFTPYSTKVVVKATILGMVIDIGSELLCNAKRLRSQESDSFWFTHYYEQGMSHQGMSPWPSAMTRFWEPTDDRLPEEMMLSNDYTLSERRVQVTRPTNLKQRWLLRKSPNRDFYVGTYLDEHFRQSERNMTFWGTKAAIHKGQPIPQWTKAGQRLWLIFFKWVETTKLVVHP